MDWFKHRTDAQHDAKLMALRREYGDAGYGKWWLLLEVIAREIPADSSKDWAEFHWKDLKKILNFHHDSSMKVWLEFAESLGLISEVTTRKLPANYRGTTAKLARISIKNIIKIRDYRPQKQKQKKSKEEEKEKESLSSPNPAKEGGKKSWNQLMIWISKGCPENQNWLDDRARAALQVVGGSGHLRRQSTTELGFIEHKFIQAYEGGSIGNETKNNKPRAGHPF